MIQKNYIIRAGLHDEANDGWVWIEGFPSRSLITISNARTDSHIVCQSRRIDRNFLNIYNGKNTPGKRYEIQAAQDTIVMSAWYRDALGGIATTSADDLNGTAYLSVRRCRFPLWGQLRAASHHPENAVRLGTRLGALGAWLGLLGALLGFLSLFHPEGCAAMVAAIVVAILLVSLGGALFVACRGPDITPTSDYD